MEICTVPGFITKDADGKCGLCDKNGDGVKVLGERGLLIGVITGSGGLGGSGDSEGNGGAVNPAVTACDDNGDCTGVCSNGRGCTVS